MKLQEIMSNLRLARNEAWNIAGRQLCDEEETAINEVADSIDDIIEELEKYEEYLDLKLGKILEGMKYGISRTQ